MPHDWRDSLRLAGDLALLGIVVTLWSLPLITAGAAVATGSYAIRHLIDKGRWPSFADCWTTFRGRLVPGLVAGPAAAAGVGLVALDIAGLRRGAVPGGAPALAVVLAAAALAAGYVALVAVRSGTLPHTAARSTPAPGAARSTRTPGAARSTRTAGAARSASAAGAARLAPAAGAARSAPAAGAARSAPAPGAARSALDLAMARPAAHLAAVGVLAVAGLLAVFVHPVLVPVLAGYALFALHVVTARIGDVIDSQVA